MIAPNFPDRQRDESDMARLLRGDDSALEALMERHGRAVLRLVQRLLRDRTEAAEVVEETFVRVYRSRQRFDFRRAFSTWLYAIARNLARDRLRRRARQPEFVPLELSDEADDAEGDEHPGEMIDSAPIPSQESQNKELAQDLAEALADLPEKLPAPLLLVALDGCSQAEVADQFRCTVKTIEMCLYHARKRLRMRLRRSFEIV